MHRLRFATDQPSGGRDQPEDPLCVSQRLREEAQELRRQTQRVIQELQRLRQQRAANPRRLEDAPSSHVETRAERDGFMPR